MLQLFANGQQLDTAGVKFNLTLKNPMFREKLEGGYVYNIDLPGTEKNNKIFRVRDEYKSGSPAFSDLIYDTIIQRNKYFYEISRGQNGLTPDSATGEYMYDRVNESTTNTNIDDHYSDIRLKTNVAFSNFVLIEFIIDQLSVKQFTIIVKMDVAPTTIYLADNNDASFAIDYYQYGGAFKVTKTIYNAFSESVGTAFTSTGYSNQLTYAGKFKHYSLEGYWLFFDSTTEVAVEQGAGTLTKVAGGATTAFLRSSGRYGSYDYEFYANWGKPKSLWKSMTIVYDADTDLLNITVTQNVNNYIQYDKIKLLIAKSGTFNISDVYMTYMDGTPKLIIPKQLMPARSFTELNTYQGFNTDWLTTGAWVNDGGVLEALPQSAPDIDDYPNLHTVYKHIKIDFDATDGFPNKISKSFTVASANGYRRLTIKVIARLYPKIFNTTIGESDYYTSTQQITDTSYDYGTLICGVKGAASPSYGLMKEIVCVGWTEILYETYMPPYETTLNVCLYRDPDDYIDSNYKNHLWPMHIYNVSVQIED